MRNEVQAQGSTLTVGELRAALEGLDDAVPVTVGGDDVVSVMAEDLSVTLGVDVIHVLPRWP